jgi:hypothetical protein
MLGLKEEQVKDGWGWCMATAKCSLPVRGLACAGAEAGKSSERVGIGNLKSAFPTLNQN